jgi:hypothetical protein
LSLSIKNHGYKTKWLGGKSEKGEKSGREKMEEKFGKR